MDKALEDRWRSGRAPFDGDCLYTEDGPPLSVLRVALEACVAVLAEHYVDRALYQMEDWHAHDGVNLPVKRSEWDSLKACIVSDPALMDFGGLDDYVYRAFYTEGFEFLLRFRVEVEDVENDEPWGQFDISGPGELLDAIQRAIRERVNVSLARRPAKSFFDESYAG